MSLEYKKEHVPELTEEERKELIERVLKDGQKESNFIITVEEWERPGESFTDWGLLRVLYGEVDKVLLEHDYNYPTTDSRKYAIIPKTRVVIMLHESKNDFEGEEVYKSKLYVFSPNTGWVSLKLV